MENKFIDQISELFNTPFPEADSLTGYLDQIIPLVKANGEDLREEKFYTNKSWIEVQDNENFHKVVLHFFSSSQRANDDEEIVEREYLKTTDGDVWRGKWRRMDSNLMMIGDDDYEEAKLYELVFMDSEFLVLKLLANPKKLNSEKKDKYFVLVAKALGQKMEWADLMRHLFEKYQSNNLIYYIIAFFIALIAIMLWA